MECGSVNHRATSSTKLSSLQNLSSVFRPNVPARGGISIPCADSIFRFGGKHYHSLQTTLDYSARRKRRNAVRAILIHVTAIRDAEQNYLDNVPDNLQGSESFEIGECAVETLDEIINLLDDIY